LHPTIVGGVSDADRESKRSTFGVGDASHRDFAVLLATPTPIERPTN